MPCRLDPFTYDHKEHAINDNRPHPHLDDILDADVAIQLDRDRFSPDVDQPVTVADLLDAVGDTGPALHDLSKRATRDVFASFRRVHHVYRLVLALSPEERTEFDRRTT